MIHKMVLWNFISNKMVLCLFDSQDCFVIFLIHDIVRFVNSYDPTPFFTFVDRRIPRLYFKPSPWWSRNLHFPRPTSTIQCLPQLQLVAAVFSFLQPYHPRACSAIILTSLVWFQPLALALGLFQATLLLHHQSLWSSQNPHSYQPHSWKHWSGCQFLQFFRTLWPEAASISANQFLCRSTKYCWWAQRFCSLTRVCCCMNPAVFTSSCSLAYKAFSKPHFAVLVPSSSSTFGSLGSPPLALTAQETPLSHPLPFCSPIPRVYRCAYLATCLSVKTWRYLGDSDSCDDRTV